MPTLTPLPERPLASTPVGRPELDRHISAGGEVTVRAVELRQRGLEVGLELRDQLPVEDRAGGAVLEPWRRRSQPGGLHQLRRRVEAGHAQNGVGQPPRHADVAGRGPHDAAAVPVQPQLRGERPLRLRDRAAGRDEPAVALNAGHAHAAGSQPCRDVADPAGRRLELRAVLSRRHEVPVLRAAGRRHGRDCSLDSGPAAARGQVHPHLDRRPCGGSSHRRLLRPAGCAVPKQCSRCGSRAERGGTGARCQHACAQGREPQRLQPSNGHGTSPSNDDEPAQGRSRARALYARSA